jgi:glucose-1-phosphate cytidylyltransferase
MEMEVAMKVQDVPVFILAGGLGTRLKEQTSLRPKPMIEIGGKPILWHIMRTYSAFGFRRFVVCAGFKAHVIKDYFLHYHAMNSDFTVKLATNDVEFHGAHHSDDWSVTVAFTGEETMTGARIGMAVNRYLGDAEHFAVTYGDGVTDVDLTHEYEFHCEHRKVGTLLGVNPPSRFGELVVDGTRIDRFSEKPAREQAWVNGGYFFFRRDFLEYLSGDPRLVLEKEPLTTLAVRGELQVFRHTGFWACMDTQRDHDALEELWSARRAPWTRSWN